MPYVGFATPVGSTSDSYDAGFRMGSFLGWHVTHQLSINGEFTIDFLNPKAVVSDTSDNALDFAFSPLFHRPIGHGNLDLVMGPKVGFFEETVSHTMTGTNYTEAYNGLYYSGLMFGANAGILAGIGNIAVGGLFNYTGRHFSVGCEMINGHNNGCTGPSGTFQMVAFNGVVLF